MKSRVTIHLCTFEDGLHQHERETNEFILFSYRTRLEVQFVDFPSTAELKLMSWRLGHHVGLAIANNICTFAVTGEEFAPQMMYQVRTVALSMLFLF